MGHETSPGQGLADHAYVTLRDSILGHELKPGTRLSVPGVAANLGISRSPAREAIARITHEGLAHATPNRGAVVADVEDHDLIEIYELRELLEGLSCRRAATRATPEETAHLRELHTEHEAAVEADDVDRHYELDQRFHAAIRHIAGNTRLASSLETLQSQIRLAMHTTRRSPGGMSQALIEHDLIVRAICVGNPDVAETLGRAHISRLLNELKRTINV